VKCGVVFSRASCPPSATERPDGWSAGSRAQPCRELVRFGGGVDVGEAHQQACAAVRRNGAVRRLVIGMSAVGWLGF